MFICTCIYIYIYRERDIDRKIPRVDDRPGRGRGLVEHVVRLLAHLVVIIIMHVQIQRYVSYI